MKKMLILVAALSMLLFAAANVQAVTLVHGGFGSDSSGCAACHITHAANAAKLLLTGNNQTEFCYDCHGTAKLKSPYDVENGVILDGAEFAYSLGNPWADWTNAGTINPSYSGGFANSYDFDTQADAVMDPADVGAAAKFNAATSAHNVSGIAVETAAWNTANKITGGTAAVVGSEFTCGSCHDPHGYNSTSAGGGGGSDNPRLLRHDLPARSDVDVNITLDIAVDAGDANNLTAGTLRTSAYPDSSINEWCGGCHDVLDVGQSAGHSKQVGAGPIDTRFRHAMGVAVNPAGVTVALGNGTPLSSANKLLCVSCHRPHGTGVSMTAMANAWNGQDYQNLGNPNGAKTGKALLRLKDRQVCYNCHGAAQRNGAIAPAGTRQDPAY